MCRIAQIVSLLSYCKSVPVKAWSKGERVVKKIQFWFLSLAVFFLLFALC